MRLIKYTPFILFAVVGTCIGQTTWTDAGGDSSWTNSSNWSSGVPINTSAVIFENPISVVGVDTGGATTIGSITVSASTDAFQIVPATTESLTVTGNFLNNSTNLVDVNLDYTFGGNSSLDGPISFNNIANVDLRAVAVGGSVAFNSSIFFQLNSVSSYGKLNLSSGASLAFGGGNASIKLSASSTYTGVNAEVFQLVSIGSGSWSGVNGNTLDLSTLPILGGGLSWNTSSFATNGSISVVPEPATWALLAASLTTVMIFRRRRQA